LKWSSAAGPDPALHLHQLLRGLGPAAQAGDLSLWIASSKRRCLGLARLARICRAASDASGA
jgi:hypothetical protein